jgi:GMP synthase (glutamine-hydrolysing)
MSHQTIAVLDYGSQYSQLICRRVREAKVYAELSLGIAPTRCCRGSAGRGSSFRAGRTASTTQGAPTLPASRWQSGAPVLGICYGLQLLAHTLGGRVTPSAEREYGAATIEVTGWQWCQSRSSADLPATLQVWMSHGDRVEQSAQRLPGHRAQRQLPAGRSRRRCAAALRHPVSPGGGAHADGAALLANFVKRICGCTGDWTRRQLHRRERRAHS